MSSNQCDFMSQFTSGNVSLGNDSNLWNASRNEEAQTGSVQDMNSWQYYIPPAIFAVIFLVGVVGNSLVIYVVTFFDKMRTVTNYYLLNLAVTDLAFLLCCVPFTAVNFVKSSWIFGEVMCKLVNYMMQVTAQATCLTLALLSLDRFCVILFPVASRTFRRRRVLAIGSTVIWIASFLLSLPVALYFRLVTLSWHGDVTVCRPVYPSSAWERGYEIYTLLALYFIPLAVCVVTCSAIVYRLCNRFHGDSVALDSQKKKTRTTSCMVIGVVALCAICWLPNHVINLWWMVTANKKFTSTIYWIKVAALILSYTNSATNPFVYTIVGQDFRTCVKSTFKCGPKKQRKKSTTADTATVKTTSSTGRRRPVPVKLERGAALFNAKTRCVATLTHVNLEAESAV